MKRFAAVFLAAALIFSLAACDLPPLPPLPERSPGTPPAQETEAPPAEELTLEVLICGEDPALGERLEELAAQYHAQTTDVRLKLELAAPDEARARIAAGELPDILAIDDASSFAAEGLLLPAGDYCPAELYADFFPALLDAGESETVWTLPDLVAVRALYYNAALLEQASVELPASWDELEEVCQGILDHYDGAVCPWGLSLVRDESAACFACYAWAGGGGFVDAEGGWALNSAENAAAVSFAVGLTNKGFTNANPASDTPDELQKSFAEGSLVMLLTDRPPDENASVALIPAAEGGSGCAVGSASRLAVFRDDDAPDPEARREAVAAFLRLYFKPEFCLERAALSGRLPATRSAAELLSLQDASCAAWTEILESCRLLPSGKSGWDEVCEGLYSAEQLALIGGEVQGALDYLQETLAGA